ncbi:LPS translocon maturation chaperone LptM [Aestuariibacter salexigens]|nr:lipoprotein [Aestuariibacter salexigens]
MRVVQRRFLLVVLCASALLTACGQTGPLYLPEPAEQSQNGDQQDEEQ